MFRLATVSCGYRALGFEFERAFPQQAGNAGALGVKWSTTTGDAVGSSPAVTNNTVYVGSNDNKVYALNAVPARSIGRRQRAVR